MVEGFLNSGVAAAALAAAVALPVIVHWLVRRREQVVEWAAMRFLAAARPRQRRRIDRWPLLLARILALLLPLAAMLAVLPGFERVWQMIAPGPLQARRDQPRTHTVLVLDASLSMSARAEGQVLIEAARSRVYDLLNQANAGDAFSLVVLEHGADVRVAGPSGNIAELRAELERVVPFHGPGDAASGLAAAADLLARSPCFYAARRVVIVTDGQRAAWEPLLAAADKPTDVWSKLTGRADVVLVDVGRDGLENLSLDDLTLSDPLPLVDEPVLVKALVSNHSNRERRQVTVELQLGRPGADGLVALDRRVLEAIPAGGQAAALFVLDGRLMPRAPGPYVLRTAIMQTDALTVDDTRAVAFEVRDSLQVLLVNGRASGVPLRRASEFFAEALAPGGRGSAGSKFRTRTVSPEEFTDATLTDLAEVDCVVLCDVGPITPTQVARLEAHLRRGRGVIVALGPNAVANRELYNRLLGPSGAAWLPGELEGAAAPAESIQFVGADAAFGKPPLAIFQDANARAGLTSVPFQSYARLRLPREHAATVLLSFSEGTSGQSLDPALLEVPRHRGRVMLFASTLNREWTEWPVLPSFLPFAHELSRYAASAQPAWTLSVGEAVEEQVPEQAIGRTAELSGPGMSEQVTVEPTATGGVARFPERVLAGIYQLRIPGTCDHPLAVNPLTGQGLLAESNLDRVEAARWAVLGLQWVREVSDIRTLAMSDAPVRQSLVPRGPVVARALSLLAAAVLALELLLAWRSGPARASFNTQASEPPATLWDRLLRVGGWLILAILAVVLAAAVPVSLSGQLPNWASAKVQEPLERMLEVPPAESGEVTRLRIVSAGELPGGRHLAWVVPGLLAPAALALYWRERRAVGSLRSLVLPLALRLGTYAALGFIVLPQLQVVFERESTPEVVLVLDDSASMGRVAGEETARLAAVQERLLADDHAWLARLWRERRMRLVVYRLSDLPALIAQAATPEDLADAAAAIATLKPEGSASRLGDGLGTIIKAHRGSGAAAIVLITDGVVTEGSDLTAAASQAGRANIPLFPVAVGQASERLDLALTDLRMDDTAASGDELIVEAKLLVRGRPQQPLVVTLSEKRLGATREVDRVELPVGSSGQPIPLQLKHQLHIPGETTYVLEAVPLPGETNLENNRLERPVLVTENRRLRVLLIDGRARYEFRFLKTLLEREVDEPGQRSLDFRCYLADAGKDYASTDRSTLRAFPTRSELFEYDVILLGDVEPRSLPRPDVNLTDLADFVRVRGGGLVLQAGDQAMPWRYFDQPLAELLPILPAGEPVLTTEEAPAQQGYRLALTPLGRRHPLLRLASDDRENATLWSGVAPMLWAPGGYRARLAAEVLATHPEHPAADNPSERLPLIVQQFFGAGRVLFLGFDESWRWRWREDEELFNRFWRQVIRVLARNRIAQADLRTSHPGPFHRQEPIVVVARFPDDAPPPDGPVRLLVEREPANPAHAADRERFAVVMEKVPGSRATYETTLARTLDGHYTLRLAETRPAANTPTLQFSVLPPPGELDRLDPDLAALSRAAAVSGGKLFDLSTFDQLPQELPEGDRLPLSQPGPPWGLWNHPLVFAMLLGLLGVEWMVRKRIRLL